MTEPCRSCGRDIHWAVTENGKPMPIDVDPTPDGNIVPHMIDGIPAQRYGQTVAHVLTAEEKADPEIRPRYTSHFATCPHAGRHRRPR